MEDTSARTFTITAPRDFELGEEVFISYGDLSRISFYVNFGMPTPFMTKRRCEDHVWFRGPDDLDPERIRCLTQSRNFNFDAAASVMKLALDGKPRDLGMVKALGAWFAREL